MSPRLRLHLLGGSLGLLLTVGQCLHQRQRRAKNDRGSVSDISGSFPWINLECQLQSFGFIDWDRKRKQWELEKTIKATIENRIPCENIPAWASKASTIRGHWWSGNGLRFSIARRLQTLMAKSCSFGRGQSRERNTRSVGVTCKTSVDNPAVFRTWSVRWNDENRHLLKW